MRLNEINKKILTASDIFEADGKNTHLDHAEEIVFIKGEAGLKEVISTFYGLLNTLDGRGGPSVTTKWDGAPAVFAGKDPEDGEFFVGTKGVFAKTPKLNKSQDDIERNHPDVKQSGETINKGGLRSKLSASLEYLKNLGIEGVVQGDLLWTKGDLKNVTIDGERMIAFTPNTITYVVPADSQTAREMLAAEIGIVFHTGYSGDRIQDMKASFGFDASNLNRNPQVWFDDATIKDVSGQVQLSPEDSAKIKRAINMLENLKIDAQAFKVLDKQLPIDLVTELKAHANAPIRSGKGFTKDPSKFANDFIEKIYDRYEAQLDKLKTGREGPAGQRKMAVQQQVIDYLKKNNANIQQMYMAYLGVESIKMLFQRKMKQLKAIDSFIEQPDGSYKVTDPEGFVIVDHEGNAMKIVDRLEFSAANFAKD